MATDVASALRKPSRRFRAPVARGIDGQGRIETDGGVYGAGLIRQAAVITRGEALGHEMWIDRDMLMQVAGAINDAPEGIKSRFAHPGLSGDGIGKALGRVRNASVVGDIVRADLHLFETSHATPDGDLGKYILDLAAEDPAAFGTSISFDPDFGEEDRFIATHEDEDGRFVSPDEDNTSNFPHARLADLAAVDVVDEPAANPDGLFHRGDELAGRAESLVAYALGLSDEAPDEFELGIAPSRVRRFVADLLQRRGLALVDARAARARARELEMEHA